MPAAFDFDAAVHAGLAVYYFPAMDDWSRSIVRPLALEGFRRAIREDRAAYGALATIDARLESDYARWSRLGDLVLHRFFAFAAAFDDFDSVLAEDDLWVPVPHPDHPGSELGTRDGRPIRYLCRLDQLIVDPDDEWWVVDHRLAWGRWATDDDLLGEQRTVRTLWALETAYPQIHVAGTIHNELLISADAEAAVASPPADVDELDRRDMSGARRTNLRRSPMTPEERILGAAFDRPDEIAHREEAHEVRRTWVRRGHGEIHLVGEQLARGAGDDRPGRGRRRGARASRLCPLPVPRALPRDAVRRRCRVDCWRRGTGNACLRNSTRADCGRLLAGSAPVPTSVARLCGHPARKAQPAIAACPTLIPPSFGGMVEWTRTRRPAPVIADSTTSASNAF